MLTVALAAVRSAAPGLPSQCLSLPSPCRAWPCPRQSDGLTFGLQLPHTPSATSAPRSSFSLGCRTFSPLPPSPSQPHARRTFTGHYALPLLCASFLLSALRLTSSTAASVRYCALPACSSLSLRHILDLQLLLPRHVRLDLLRPILHLTLPSVAARTASLSLRLSSPRLAHFALGHPASLPLGLSSFLPPCLALTLFSSSCPCSSFPRFSFLLQPLSLIFFSFSPLLLPAFASPRPFSSLPLLCLEPSPLLLPPLLPRAYPLLHRNLLQPSPSTPPHATPATKPNNQTT